QDMMVTKWESYTDESLTYWKSEGDGHLPTACISAVTTVARDFCMYLYLGMLVIKGSITIGIFSQMISACRELTDSVISVGRCLQEITKRCNYAYEYVKFMHYPAAIEKGSRPVTPGEHVIEFRDVSFAYPKTEVQVLEHVNLKLKAGEHLSVVGLNGAGKTTFVKLLCRLYDPTEGEILLDNVNIKEYDYEQYMNLFSPVFQDFKLFAFSIKDNILMGEEEKDGTNEALHALFEQVGFSDKLASLEHGMDTMLFKSFDKEGIEASGGEQQKLAIARALYKHAPVVILDEPTAALDPIAEYEIYRQFHSLVGGKTAIYISHRLSSCRFCDHIAVFSDGHVAEYGTHDTLVGKENGIYAEMFAAQAQYYQ
ncbi:MAG: ABC transporter ATP-binding protein/permease, partial [Lachnospiraceae bacterium]|nr:ABC transporter ATP-binding protein/permease [Lachnospiraceae bacterium]